MSHAELVRLKRENSACRSCKLRTEDNAVVLGVGPFDAPLMIIAEQADDEDDLMGEPFSGRKGKVFRMLLEGASIDPSDVYLTLALRCYTGKEKPNRTCFAACRGWISREALVVKPRAMLLLGKTTATSLLTLPSSTKLDSILAKQYLLQYARDGSAIAMPWHSLSKIALGGKKLHQQTTQVLKQVKEIAWGN